MKPDDGERAVRLARKAAESWVAGRRKPSPEEGGVFSENRGVFVSMHTYPERSLRGCIGFPEPVMPLGRAIVEAAVSACHDPRFPPVEEKELESILIEVSVLTKPEPLRASPEKRPLHVKTGRDGLIVRKPPFSGLLLPQVAVEYGFSPEEFLSQTCLKAGLPPDEWRSGECEVWSFRAEVFKEQAPNGTVVKSS